MANAAEAVNMTTFSTRLKDAAWSSFLILACERVGMTSSKAALGRFRNPWNPPFQTPTRAQTRASDIFDEPLWLEDGHTPL